MKKWNKPSKEEVSNAVESVGGINTASRLVRKHRNTIRKWCNGEKEIDYSNWKTIKNKADSTICLEMDEKLYNDVLNELYGYLNECCEEEKESTKKIIQKFKNAINVDDN